MDLGAAREHGLAQPAELVDALARGGGCDGGAALELFRVDAFQLIERLRSREVRISHHGAGLYAKAASRYGNVTSETSVKWMYFAVADERSTPRMS